MTGVLFPEHRNPPVVLSGGVVDAAGGEVVHTVGEDIRILHPETTIAVVLDPGTMVSSAAVRSLVDGGCSVLWSSAAGLRVKAMVAAPTLTDNVLAMRQSASVSTVSARRATYRRALRCRFPDEEVPARLGLNQLRGWEGARMSRAYRDACHARGLAWGGRSNEGPSDFVNALVSSTNAVVYTAVQALSASMMLNPHTGYCHVGSDSWTYDVADLFKFRASFLRCLEWFAGRDHTEDLPSAMQQAKAFRQDVFAEVAAGFHAAVDAVLVEGGT